jgi:hypothetical protein
MASREALLASVGADLKTYYDAEMGLPGDEMQKLTSSVTDRIPEPSCPLQLAATTRAIATWQDAEWLSPAAAADLRSRMVNALVAANNAKARAVAAVSSVSGAPSAASGTRSAPESSAGASVAPSSSKGRKGSIAHGRRSAGSNQSHL